MERVLVVDDDDTFRGCLTSALARRGFDTASAKDVPSAQAYCRETAPSRMIVDLKMPGQSGLELLQWVQRECPQTKVVILTGYGSIATAIEAIKLGAINYVTKPADTEQILAAFAEPAAAKTPKFPVPSLEAMEWEHINRVMTECGGNISRASKALGLHRRSLQRKLAKAPTKKVGRG